MKAAVNYYKDLMNVLKDPEEASAYLNAALEAGDTEAFLIALKNVLDAQGGMTKISDKTKIKRGSLYKMLSKNGNPGFENILCLLQAVGIRFQITPKSSHGLRKKAA